MEKFDPIRPMFTAQLHQCWHSMLQFVAGGHSLFAYPHDPLPVQTSKVNILRPLMNIDTAIYADNIFVADFLQAD